MGVLRRKLISFNPSCLIKCFLWSLLLILQGCCPFPGSDGSCTKAHYRPKIEKNSTIYNLRMQKIKQDLVEKMGLHESTEIDNPRNHIPEAILQEFWEETARYDERDRTESSRQVKKLMVHAEKASDGNCIGCVRFFHQSSSLQSELTTSDLWIHQDQSGKSAKAKSVVEVHVIDKKKKKMFLAKSTIIHPKVGWHRVNLKDISSWTSSSTSGYLKIDLLLQIACVHCTVNLEGKTLPYLDLSEESMVKRRTRRSAKCTTEASTCCLDVFEIEFHKFVGELADAIILPKSVNVGQCRGSCDTPHVASDAHSGIIQSTKIKSSNKITLCCVPHKYKSFATLIFNGTDEIVIRNINDMVVSECGCA